jgi:hypothetical protein
MIARFAPAIIRVTDFEIRNDPTLAGHLTLDRETSITVNWAPFDHVNPSARIVLVGITPGRQQAVNALIEARRLLHLNASLPTVSEAAKNTASFSGAMRGNLVAQLDHIGIHRFVGIAGCAGLFGADAGLVHYTSALRYPVFVDGENYSGQPNMIRHRLLRDSMAKYLGEEAKALPNAVWIPLGPRPTEALLWLAEGGILDRNRILDGLQHPSGANAERIAYFLGRKPKSSLSVKTNAATIDAARDSLMRRLATL